MAQGCVWPAFLTRSPWCGCRHAKKSDLARPKNEAASNTGSNDSQSFSPPKGSVLLQLEQLQERIKVSCLPVHSVAQRVFEHVLPCRRTKRMPLCEVFHTQLIFQLLQQKYEIQTSNKTVCIHAGCIPSVHGQEMMWIRQYPHFSSFSTWPYSASFHPFWCHPHLFTEITLVFDERPYIPSSVLSPTQVLIRFLRNVFPTAIRLMGDRSSFVQEVPRDLHFFSMILAICVVEDVYKHLDIPILEFWDHHHKAEWLVLPLKLPKTRGHPSRQARSRPKVVGFVSNLHHMPVVFPIARLPLPKIGEHRSPTAAFVRTPWVVLDEACLSIRGQRCRPLAETTSLRVSTFETGFGGSFFPSRIPKPQKLSSMSSTRRSHEDVLFRRRQSAPPWTHSALCRSGFGLSPASTQQVSNQRLLDLELAGWDVPFHSRFLSLGLKFFLLLSEFLPSQLELFHRLAVGPYHQNLDCQNSWQQHHAHKAFCVPVHRPADVSTTERATGHQHEIANKLRMPNGSANLGLESENLGHPFDRELCQFGDDQSPSALWLSWQQDGW